MHEHQTHDADAPAKAAPAGKERAPAQLAGLQATAGNRAIQRLVSGDAGDVDGAAVAARITAAEAGGNDLDPSLRERVRGAIGADPGAVRIHADSESDSLSRTLGAQAFTTGRDVFFREGAFDPESPAGFDLLAHESVHVVQQASGPVAGTPTPDGALSISDPGDSFERAARSATAQVPAAAPPSGGPVVQRKPEKISFDDDPDDVITVSVKTLDPMALGDGRKQIMNDMATLTTAMRSAQAAITGGIDTFLTDQVFAGKKEAEANYNAAFMKFALKKLLEFGVDKIGEQISETVPYLKTTYELTFGLMEEMNKEGERAEKAKGEVEVGKFINEYREKIVDGFNEKIKKGDTAANELISHYEALTAGGGKPHGGKGGAPKGAATNAQPTVVGEAAHFLNEVSAIAKGYQVPTVNQALQVIVEEWVKSSEGDLMTRGGGDHYVNGRIEIDATMDRDGNTWTVGDRPDTGTLVTNRADHVVKSLDLILQHGKTINDIDIEKVLTIDVEDEVFGFNDHYKVEVSWRTPYDVMPPRVRPEPINDDTMSKAHGIGVRAVHELDINSLKITKLEAVEDEGTKI